MQDSHRFWNFWEKYVYSLEIANWFLERPAENWCIVVIQSTDTVAKCNMYLINFKKLNMTNSQHGEFEIYFTYCFAQNATSILRI